MDKSKIIGFSVMGIVIVVGSIYLATSFNSSNDLKTDDEPLYSKETDDILNKNILENRNSSSSETSETSNYSGNSSFSDMTNNPFVGGRRKKKTRKRKTKKRKLTRSK